MSVDLAKLNRPGVMSSYSSSGRKNTVHASKGQVAGSTFNSARMQAASKFLEPSKGGHVAAKRMFSNAAPRYWNGQEMSMQMKFLHSNQITSYQADLILRVWVICLVWVTCSVWVWIRLSERLWA